MRRILPILTAAVLLFAEGIAGIHHAHHIHKLARNIGSDLDASRIVQEIHDKVDALPPERSREVLEVLLAEYGKP